MNQQSTLVGLFKETYAGQIVEAWSFMAKLLNRVKFVQRELQPGNFYHQPVDLTFEHGITAAAAGVTPGVGGAPFLPVSAGQMQDAQVTGAQLIGRSSVSYEAIARSSNSKAAFKQATQHVVRRLSRAVTKRAEIQLIHGQRGIGTVNANPATGASRAIVISDATWAAGIWAGLVGATLDLYSAGGAKLNTGASSTNDPIKITAINTSTKTITVSVGNAGDQTLNIASANIFFETASPTSEMAGLDVVSSLTGASPALWNINPATYDLWQGNQYNVAGALSFAKILSAISLAAPYDFSDAATCIVTPEGFEVLNTDIAALRQYDVSYTESRAKRGNKALTFFAQTGEIEILPHAFEKHALAHIFVPTECARVGASEIDFITRQGSEDKLILESATSAGSEMRCYSNQAFFASVPRHCVQLYGIT